MMPVNFVNNCSFAFKMANTCTYVLQGFQGLLDKVHPIIKVKCCNNVIFFLDNFQKTLQEFWERKGNTSLLQREVKSQKCDG